MKQRIKKRSGAGVVGAGALVVRRVAKRAVETPMGVEGDSGGSGAGMGAVGGVSQKVVSVAGDRAHCGEAGVEGACEELGADGEESALSASEALELELSVAQRRAIQMMLSGVSMAKSAKAAGVTRVTLYRWLKQDAQFRAAYNAWQHDAILGAQTKLLALADRAVTTVAGAIDHDARLAMQLLKLMGVTNAPKPGSTEPEDIRQEMEIERRETDAERGERMMKAVMRELNGLSPK